MIIVSQDRDNIVNFDNVVSVGIEDFDLNDKNCFQRITAETLGTSVLLGDYKTEERAKEVLKEITRMYQETRITYRGQANYNPVNSIDRPIYEMPKE